MKVLDLKGRKKKRFSDFAPEALLEMRKIRHYGKLIDPFAVFVK